MELPGTAGHLSDTDFSAIDHLPTPARSANRLPGGLCMQHHISSVTVPGMYQYTPVISPMQLATAVDAQHAPSLQQAVAASFANGQAQHTPNAMLVASLILRAATRQCRPEILRLLMQFHNFKPDTILPDGRPLLHAVAATGHRFACVALLMSGAETLRPEPLPGFAPDINQVLHMANTLTVLNLRSLPEVRRTPLENHLLRYDIGAARQELERSVGMPLTPENVDAVWNKALDHPHPEWLHALLALYPASGHPYSVGNLYELKQEDGADYSNVYQRARQFGSTGLIQYLRRFAYPSRHDLGSEANHRESFDNGKSISCEPLAFLWLKLRYEYRKQRTKMLQVLSAGHGNWKQNKRFLPRFDVYATSYRDIRVQMKRHNISDHTAEKLYRHAPEVHIMRAQPAHDWHHFSVAQFRRMDQEQPWPPGLSERSALFFAGTTDHAVGVEFKIKKDRNGNKDYIQLCGDSNHRTLHSRKNLDRIDSTEAPWRYDHALLDPYYVKFSREIEREEPESIIALPVSDEFFERVMHEENQPLILQQRCVTFPAGDDRFLPSVFSQVLGLELHATLQNMTDDMLTYLRTIADDEDKLTALFAVKNASGNYFMLCMALDNSPVLDLYLDILVRADIDNQIKLDILALQDRGNRTCMNMPGYEKLLAALDRLAVAPEDKVAIATNTVNESAVAVLWEKDTTPEKVRTILQFIDAQQVAPAYKTKVLEETGLGTLMFEQMATAPQEEIAANLHALLEMKTLSWKAKAALLRDGNETKAVLSVHAWQNFHDDSLQTFENTLAPYGMHAPIVRLLDELAYERQNGMR
jgi:hypothetical protein